MSRPSGTVTFLFSDIEGSTQRWERDAQAMSAALARHDALLREAIESHGGYVFKVIGDAFCAAFATVPNAVAAALHAQRSLATGDFSGVNGLRVRMAVHTGHAEERNDDYFGPTVNRVARLLEIGHGGQVLVSRSAADLLQSETSPGFDLRDLGLHGLKDLARAERVFQAIAPELEQVFPALRSREGLPNNLPAQLTSFVGRDRDVAELTGLLQRGRLVTLVGPGGVGKTRCAIQAGAELLQTLPDGVWLIDLAPISDASLVAGTIAQTLAIREAPNRPLLETLCEYLASRELLLIFDNCEHLIAPARSAAAEILRRCPGVRILSTSREALNIAGEHALRLPSLDVPASIALFVDRASSADPSFALTAQRAESVTAIVERLDGMPLAIELAAARVKVLSPAQIAQRLGERFRMLTGGDRSALRRQQTLRATIDWSYDLLGEQERALFRKLAIFAGGFTLAAATQVCGTPEEIDEWEILDSLVALVDKSLVAVEPSGDDRRYRMLQSIRDYGLDRLRESEEEHAIAERHAQYYARFVAGLAPLVNALEDERWRTLCAPELDNLRAAIDWTLFRRHDPATGLDLLSQVEWPEVLTAPQEALRWYERAIEEAPSDETAFARLLRHCVLLQWLVGWPPARREETATRAVEVAKRSGDANEVARALANLGACYRSAGRFEDAEAIFVEAYADPERLSRLTLNAVLRLWAVTDLQRGNMESARRRFQEVVRSERPGSESHASALLNVGELEYAAGNIEAAREAARRAHETYASLGSTYLVLALSNLGAYAMAADDLADSRKRLSAALAAVRRTGRGWITTLLDHHALLAALLGDHERAATLVGFTDGRYRALGEVRQYTEQCGYDRLVTLLAQRYDRGELERLTSAGAALTEEQAFSTAALIYETT